MAAAILKTYDLGYRQQRELAVADNQCVILRDKLSRSDCFIHISGHPSATYRAQDRESSSVKSQHFRPIYWNLSFILNIGISTLMSAQHNQICTMPNSQFAAWRRPRPVARCRQFLEEAKDASVSECTWTLSALEALRNALYPRPGPISKCNSPPINGQCTITVCIVV